MKRAGDGCKAAVEAKSWGYQVEQGRAIRNPCSGKETASPELTLETGLLNPHPVIESLEWQLRILCCLDLDHNQTATIGAIDSVVDHSEEIDD